MSEFNIQEIALGGIGRRNRFVSSADLSKVISKFLKNSNGNGDCYVSSTVYPDSVISWLKNNGNQIKGYDGVVDMEFLTFDFDYSDNPEKAQQEVIHTVNYWIHEFGINPDDLRIGFSGRKGFHVQIPKNLIDIKPHNRLDEILKLFVEKITPEKLETLDYSIYKRNMMIRCFHTKHNKSGLYKIPLTWEELNKLSIDKIKKLAKKPRQKFKFNCTDVEVNNELSEYFEALVKEVESSPKEKSSNKDYNKIYEACKVSDGERNNVITSEAGLLLSKGFSKEKALLHLSGINEVVCNPPIEYSEIEQIVDSIFSYEAEDMVITPEKFQVSEFPTDILPVELRDILKEFSKSIDCPIDFIFCGLLGVAASVISGKANIYVKTGWVEPCVLFILIVSRSGDGKSPALDIIRKPFLEKQQEWFDKFKEDLKDFNSKRLKHEVELRTWKSKESGDNATGSEPPEFDEARPFPKQFETNDTTTEALSEILNNGDQSILVYFDEGVSWVKSLNQYKVKGADREHYLKFHNGSPTVVNRKGKDPIFILKPRVSVLGGIQPDKLNELIDTSQAEDGFIQRILFSYPESKETEGDFEIKGAVLNKYNSFANKLIKFPEMNDIVLSGKTKTELYKFKKSIKEEFSNADFPDYLQPAWNKLIAHTIRFSLVIHIIEQLYDVQKNRFVELPTFNKAVKLADYFKSHIKKTFSHLIQTTEDYKIDKVMKYIQKQGGNTSVRDIITAKHTKSAKETKQLFLSMQDRGLGRAIGTEKGSMRFELYDGNKK